ncbi:MAG: ABC transporter permease subunit, partial [bacterium]
FALNSDKVDVAFMDEASLKEIFSKNPELGVLDPSVFIVPIAAGFNMENDRLREQFNTFLREIRTNGIYQDMVDRWMEKGLSEMPEIKTPATNGTLKPGIVSDLGLPFTVIKDGQLIGFDIELSKRFAASVGKEFEPVDLPFASMLASVSTNKIDIITSSLMITEERKKQINFSDPYFESGVSVIAKKKNIVKPTLPLYSKLDDIADKKIGIFTGTVHDAFISKKYPKAQIFRFESTPDMMMSVKNGKVDFAMFDLITANIIIKHNPELGILSSNVLNMPLGVGFSKGNDVLRNEFNDFLKEARKDGTYDTIYKRWFTGDPETAVMPPFKPPSGSKKLVAGISIDDLPYVAEMNGNFFGFDIELLNNFAKRKNYQIEFVAMEFPSLVPALVSGKVEMITDGIAISEECAKQIDFSDPYAEFRTAIVAPIKNLARYAGTQTEAPKTSLFTKISNSFYSNIVFEKRYLHIINGLYITLVISIFAALFGTMVGALVCFMRMSKRRILSVTARTYISVLRGTPVLVLLMIIYYVVFASVNINPVAVAIFAFGLNFGAYVSEMFRTSIQSIDNGQKEAAIAGGFTKIQTFIYIILPQAMRQILPVYKGEFISLIKMTSIVGYIAVQDLTKASDIIRSRTFDAFFPLIMVAVLYFLLALLLTWALGLIEISVDPKRKRHKREKEAAK